MLVFVSTILLCFTISILRILDNVGIVGTANISGLKKTQLSSTIC